MIHKGGTIRQETFLCTVTHGNKSESTLCSNIRSVSILYEAVFTDILCTFAHVIPNEYQMPVFTQFSIHKTDSKVSHHILR